MPQKPQNKAVDMVRKDVFAVIWIALIAIIILLTLYGKHIMYEMITVSILFLLFLLLEPVMKMSHGSKISQYISGGKYVPPWKRFPIFFVVVLIVFTIKHYLENYLEHAFPEEHVNVVLVLFWFIALFSIYHLIVTKQHDDEQRSRAKVKRSGNQ